MNLLYKRNVYCLFNSLDAHVNYIYIYNSDIFVSSENFNF